MRISDWSSDVCSSDLISILLDRFAQGGIWGAAIGTGVLTAALSAIMNNMPTVLVGALSIDGSHASGVVKEAMIYANVIGCDLGPKITPIGSLAKIGRASCRERVCQYV